MSRLSSPPATSRFAFAVKASLLAIVVCLSMLPKSSAAPLRATSFSVPDLWAQLLRADRYKLIPSSPWITRGDNPHSSLQSNTSQRGISVEEDAAWTARNQHTHLETSSRQKIYMSPRGESKFVCHVYNPPASINVDPVIRHVIVIASQSWSSRQEVVMKVDFKDLGEPNILANGGGTYFVQMSDTFDTVLPVAAAEAVRGADLNGNEEGDGKYDVLATINSRTPWYDGTDATPPEEKYDLATVLLHEIYHNLVFAGSVTATYEQQSNGVIQSASIHKGYRTRFDSFLANQDNCAVLGYLKDEQLASQLGRPNSQLLADAVCNDQLYWGYGGVKVAKLFSPRIFQKKSSIYHLDPNAESPENSIMFPTVRRGTAQHAVGAKILAMQKISLDPKIPGANTRCPFPLRNPAPQAPVQQSDFGPPVGVVEGGPLVLQNRYHEENKNRVAGLPVWAFALIIIFAIILALLLLALCIALLLRALRRKKRSATTTSHTGSKNVGGTGTSSSSRNKSYIPGVGGTSHKTSRTSRSSSGSRKATSVKPASKHTTSKHTEASRKTSSKHSEKPETEKKPATKRHTCPSSGKSKYLCCCKCCKSSLTPPPPVASVHTFDPESVPTARASSHKHKSSSHHHHHKHIHSCHKTVKKSCKSKSVKTCCACYCCKYKPSTCKSSSTCCKWSSKASSSRCPPSTKPPSVKPAVTKAPSSKHSYSHKHCTSKCPSKSSSGKSCSCSKSVTKSCSCSKSATKSCSCSKSATKSCSCSKSATKSCSCSKSATKSCSCSKSTSKVPSIKPPSTKPPSTKPPTTKPPTTVAAASSKKSCRTCKASCKSCKPYGNRCACTRCEQIVEINIC